VARWRRGNKAELEVRMVISGRQAAQEGRSFSVAVDCERTPEGEEVPVRFRLGRRTVAVKEVSDRWLARDHRYFKITADTGTTYILRHDVVTDVWEIVMFRAPE
jgi:hypothetical protein